ncbi:Thiol-disulfide oxidoreductase ResA [Gimesia panareensis]|uniref:Thiol-disulfide oxidoreductase ResA n=1 Tax=Gimesia panareensis TaxID=2527978 RepID=A0A517Q3V4_9PLAN|nr:TlpA disulfide reductase family protein [Gimesia panareensis]QDT26293.1 Thiol-disulfide oxidoreductase ResA [Gimesia panareensis]
MSFKPLVFALSLCLLSACGKETSTVDSAPEESAPPAETAAAKAEPKSPSIPGAQTFDKDGITAEIAGWDQVQEFIQKQKGKVVVMDLWSTWCEPCVAEFPHLVELQKKYPDQVVCISYNMNYDGSKDSPPESNKAELMEFYTKHKADIVNIISSTPDMDLYEKVNLASIPAAYVYGPDGKLAKRFDNEKQEYGKEGFTYKEHIIPYIDELLKQPKESKE